MFSGHLQKKFTGSCSKIFWKGFSKEMTHEVGFGEVHCGLKKRGGGREKAFWGERIIAKPKILSLKVTQILRQHLENTQG